MCELWNGGGGGLDDGNAPCDADFLELGAPEFVVAVVALLNVV